MSAMAEVDRKEGENRNTRAGELRSSPRVEGSRDLTGTLRVGVRCSQRDSALSQSGGVDLPIEQAQHVLTQLIRGRVHQRRLAVRKVFLLFLRATGEHQ